MQRRYRQGVLWGVTKPTKGQHPPGCCPFCLQIVQKAHKEMPRLGCIIRVQSGRDRPDAPQTSGSPYEAMQAIFCGCRCFRQDTADPLKKTVPRQCEAIAVARTDYQIPPDSRKCSGVSIPQAVSLSPPFHDTACILFLAQKVPGALPFGGVHPVLLYVRFFAGCF